MPTRVVTGSRFHFGFLNLSLAHRRIYGGLGLALTEPKVSVTVARADELSCRDDDAALYANRCLELLDVPGARVEIESTVPRHVGLGSGTQLALAIYAGMAREYDTGIDVRTAAPALDRGGRSGVGVAGFEEGGFVIDAGHPTERFTTDRPPRGEWSVPPISVRHEVPEDWRFLLVRPDVSAGRSGEQEDESMRAIVERAEPEITSEIASVVMGRLLPAIASGDHGAFGRALSEINRLNGVWYAGEQGGVYRPPVGQIVDVLEEHDALSGAGQSSWGPTAYGITHEDHTTRAREAGERALETVGYEGTVRVVRPRNEGASTEEI